MMVHSGYFNSGRVISVATYLTHHKRSHCIIAITKGFGMSWSNTIGLNDTPLRSNENVSPLRSGEPGNKAWTQFQ